MAAPITISEYRDGTKPTALSALVIYPTDPVSTGDEVLVEFKDVETFELAVQNSVQYFNLYLEDVRRVVINPVTYSRQHKFYLYFDEATVVLNAYTYGVAEEDEMRIIKYLNSLGD